MNRYVFFGLAVILIGEGGSTSKPHSHVTEIRVTPRPPPLPPVPREWTLHRRYLTDAIATN